MKLFFSVAAALLSIAAAQPSGGGDCDAANYFWNAEGDVRQQAECCGLIDYNLGNGEVNFDYLEMMLPKWTFRRCRKSFLDVMADAYTDDWAWSVGGMAAGRQSMVDMCGGITGPSASQDWGISAAGRQDLAAAGRQSGDCWDVCSRGYVAEAVFLQCVMDEFGDRYERKCPSMQSAAGR